MTTNNADGEVTNIQPPPAAGDVTNIQPPPPPRNALSEIGTGFARGALVDLPTMAGKALQFAGADNVGATVRGFGEDMGKDPSLTMQPEAHSGVTNFIASGVEQLPTIGTAALGAGAAALALPELAGAGLAGSLTAGAIGATPGAAMLAGAQGQGTTEAGIAKGLTPESAAAAGRLDAATTFGTQVAAGAFGGQVLAGATGALGKLVGKEAGDQAAAVLGGLTGSGGWLMPGLKAAGLGAVENTAIGAVQTGASAAINNAYGIDDQSPLSAAIDSIPQSLALSGVLGGMGLAGRAYQVKGAAAKTATLASEKADPALRTRLADQYATTIEQQSGNADAARAFSQNAQTAIDHGLPLKVDAGLFDPGSVKAPVPEAPLGIPPAAPIDQQAAIDANVGVKNPLPLNADGTVLSRKDFGALDGNESLKGAELAKAYKAYTTDPDVVARVQRAADFGEAYNEKSGQFGTDPVTGQERELTMGEVMDRQAGPAAPATPEAPTPLLPYNAPPEAIDQMVADSNGLVKKADDAYTFPDGSTSKDINDVKDFFTRQSAEQAQQPAMLQLLHNPTPPEVERMVATSDGLVQKEGDTFRFPDGSTTNDIKQVQSFFAEKAQRDAARASDPSLPKASDEITNDIAAANKAVTGDNTIKQQALKPLQKQLDSLGLDKMGSHQEQIDALEARLNDGDAKIGDATRGRMEALLTQWKGETPQEPGTAVGARPAEVEGQGTPEAAAAAAEGIRAMNTANADPDALQATLNANKTMTDGMRARAQTYIDQVREAKAAAPPLVHTPEDATAAGAGAISVLTKPGVDPGAAGDAVRAEQLAALKARNDKFQNAVAAIQGADTRINGEAPAQADTLPQNIGASVESRAPAETNNALPENIPASVQAQSPGADEALPNNLTQSPRSHAQDTADMVDASLASFNQRLRGGEKLTPLEQERYEDLQGFRGTLGEITAKGNHSDDYTQNISEMAREAATAPYKQTFRRYVPENPEATDPSIMREALRTGKLVDTLNSIATNGSTPEVKALADRLAKLDTGTTIKYAAPDGTGTGGEYLPATNHVNIYPGGESEQTILHEGVHAAQQSLVSRAEAITSPKTQREAELKKAFNAIESIRQTAIERAGEAQYGLTNAHEFLAELNTNPEFQKFLKSEQVNKQSLWSRAVSAVKSLFGMKTEGDFLSKAMEANEAFFQKPGEAGFPLPAGSQPDALFSKSPSSATKVVDDQYSKLGKLADSVTDKFNIAKASTAIYKALASTKTVDYLADRIRALPEMVQSGFAKGVDAYVHAHESKKIAAMMLGRDYDTYADKLGKMRNALGDKARDVEESMARISGEASRGGFDYRMNYADNAKAGRAIPAANKSYVDDMHREFTQLQRSNPEAAKAIVDGQLLNHKLLVNLTSTISRNLMEVAAGSYTKLAADLSRMAPNDAARAAQEARVKGAQPAHEMARAHGGKLDILDKSLETARNTKPDTFYDGRTQALDARLNDMFTSARNLPEGSPLRGHLNELEQMYRAQAQNPYFSLGRSGDFFVKAALKEVDEATQAKIQNALKGSGKVVGNLVGNDGNIFMRVQTQDQAMALHDKLLEAAGLKMIPKSNAWGKLAYNSPSMVKGTSDALRSMLSDLHSTVNNSGVKGDAADAMRETLTRSLLSLLPETSSRSAKMSRQGVPGYDADYLGNFSRRATGGVQDMSNIYTQRAFDDSFNQMKTAQDQLNRTGSADGRVRAQITADEITKRYANLHTPVDNSMVNTLNAFGHAFYLAISPAYLIRTTAQPLHRGLPLVGSRYGMVNSAKAIAGSTKDAMAITTNSLKGGWQEGGMRGVLDARMDFQNSKLSESEKAFVQELHDRGILNLGQTRQLQQMSTGSTQGQRDLVRFTSMTAQVAEMTNRLAMGLAAFRLAEKGTKNVTQAGREANTEYAVKVVNRAMDNFDAHNTARAISKYGFAGKWTPLMTAFMNYNLQTMQQIARTVHDGMFNQDKSAEGKQRASEARKEFAGLMGTTMMISGAMGLPFASVFAGLYNTYKDATDPDNPGDIRVDIQNFLAKTLGKTAGEVVSHGLPRLANFDSSTFGLENLLPGSEFLASRQLLADRLANTSASMMGPALNGGIGILQAMDKIKDGYVMKGVEAALPSGLKPYAKAYDLAHNGYTDAKGNPLPLGKPNGWDIARQAVGFNSGEKATQIEAQGQKQMFEDRIGNRKTLLQDQFAKGVMRQDPEQRADAMGSIRDFNAANPALAITNPGQTAASRIRALALGNALGAGVSVQNERMLPTLAHQLAFARDAAMPGE